eukprot:scaffold1205_cov249-Pinguiococcus_pyrenoidosus.AAC.3
MTSNSLLASTSVAAKDRLFEDLRVEADFVAPPDAARLLRGRGLDANRRSNLIEWFVDVSVQTQPAAPKKDSNQTQRESVRSRERV